jgi:hypothetical protein
MSCPMRPRGSAEHARSLGMGGAGLLEVWLVLGRYEDAADVALAF